MRTTVTELDRRLHVLWVLNIMKKFRTTSLIAKRRDENDEYGMLLFSDVAKEVITRKSNIIEHSALCENYASQC
jgi:hypothetical protein